jgi:hypothetical protein
MVDRPREPDRITGRTYLERGQPVIVLTRWRAATPPAPGCLHWQRPPRGAPRNVLIERADGSRMVRPFRGLRRPPANKEE